MSAKKKPTTWYAVAQSKEDPKHYLCCEDLSGKGEKKWLHTDEMSLGILLGDRFFSTKEGGKGKRECGLEFTLVLKTPGNKTIKDNAGELPIEMVDLELLERPEPAKREIRKRVLRKVRELLRKAADQLEAGTP